ncbi:hypothetical protein AKJ57_03525 [candidate division MSBL1 archaeon SCGC-AAA259A05]|uniref:Right handed beta helix domain-containing protein n=1 Tax=candidate division MSBL1 archaeon SCGC-AAA259A05 TaxID=1698259 RepID=A0A133U9I4_9EURY|nr:hypothetical protein AKJ57_03525 [candidate division MSBL1 archaeon SCGC-AAA259A05]
MPEGDYDPIRVNREDITLYGSGEKTVIKAKTKPAVELLLSSRVRISNIKLETKENNPGILFGREISIGTVLDNLIINSGGDGIYKPSEAISGRGSILNCQIDADECGILAESGSGAFNYLAENKGKANRDFIRWGVNNSCLLQNESNVSNLWLTKESHNNLCINPDIQTNDQSGENTVF